MCVHFEDSSVSSMYLFVWKKITLPQKIPAGNFKISNEDHKIYIAKSNSHKNANGIRRNKSRRSRRHDRD